MRGCKKSIWRRCAHTGSGGTAVLAVLSTLAALVVSDPAVASAPTRWCGTSAAGADRRPDIANGPSIHVIYAYSASAADRFKEWAPRIVGDLAAIDLWWRAQDSTRAPRFDLHGFPCASTVGRLDLTRVQLRPAGGASAAQSAAFPSILRDLSSAPLGFRDPDKLYLVYYDGATASAQICGTGSEARAAVIFVRNCGQEANHGLRTLAVAHELLHVLGAVPAAAPNVCPASPGHVCDSPADLLYPTVTSRQALAGSVLDAGRDDYYGHTGLWSDAQDSPFLERLDSADRAAPAPPADLGMRADEGATATLSWQASTDDVGPGGYRLYRDGRLLRSDLRQARGYDVLPAGRPRSTQRARWMRSGT